MPEDIMKSNCKLSGKETPLQYSTKGKFKVKKLLKKALKVSNEEDDLEFKKTLIIDEVLDE